MQLPYCDRSDLLADLQVLGAHPGALAFSKMQSSLWWRLLALCLVQAALVLSQGMSGAQQLVFVVGSKASSRSNFQAQTRMIQTMIDRYQINSGNTQVGVISYGSNSARSVIPLGGSANSGIRSLNSAVRGLSYPGGNGNVQLGLNAARQLLQRSRKAGGYVASTASSIAAGGVGVSAVGMGGELSAGMMSSMSSGSEGLYVSNPNDLYEAAGRLAVPVAVAGDLGEKKGKCPPEIPPEGGECPPIDAGEGSCLKDGDCSGTQKCCSPDGC